MAVGKQVRFVCAGIGGYAWSIAQQMMGVAESESPEIRLAAMCDPNLDQFAERIAKLSARGINTYRTFEEMLAREPADAAWLPLPIHLHRPFTEQALAAGKHVVTEKPAAGSLQDVDAMIAARDRAGKAVLVGFQDIYARPTAPAKQAVLNGQLGRVTHATVCAGWPRDLSYFSRNEWAGAIAMNGVWVLDSPLQNAISHYLNLALFLLGPQPLVSATPEAVEAELYRANDIDNYDTCALRLTLPGGVKLIVFLTHAVSNQTDATVVLHGTEGSLTVNSGGYQIAGKQPFAWPADDIKHANMIRTIARHIRGEPVDGALATLEMARLHTQIVNGVSEAAPVVDFDRAHVSDAAYTQNGTVMKAVCGLEEVMLRCVAEQKLPSELGDISWSKPGGSKDLRNYNAFAGPKTL